MVFQQFKAVSTLSQLFAFVCLALHGQNSDITNSVNEPILKILLKNLILTKFNNY